MPKEIITNGAFRRGNPWMQVGWARGQYVQIGVLTEGPEARQDTLVPAHQTEDGGIIKALGAEGESLFCDLDRDGINKLIRSLRKARDQAYGSDA
jgi:hypothetical protein